jgi:hypothetical protein
MQLTVSERVGHSKQYAAIKTVISWTYCGRRLEILHLQREMLGIWLPKAERQWSGAAGSLIVARRWDDF